MIHPRGNIPNIQPIIVKTLLSKVKIKPEMKSKSESLSGNHRCVYKTLCQ